jgi:hypothetical protein
MEEAAHLGNPPTPLDYKYYPRYLISLAPRITLSLFNVKPVDCSLPELAEAAGNARILTENKLPNYP